ncbi:MAG: GntR family transcriptional regulator [Rhodospirillaceae bacterium]|nr:GntR family transcriptional regulator [Rhodospirillaceae bacterium]
MSKYDAAHALRNSLKSLPDYAHELLRREIISGALAPNEPLKQAHIAARLGLSIAPVREALRRLESEGLVVSRRHHGFLVESLDPAEIDDIFEMRIWIEGRTSYHSAMQRTDEDVAHLEEIVRDMEKCSDPETVDLGRWAALNRDFHLSLFRISGRQHLAKVAMSLLDAVERYVWIDHVSGHGLKAAQQEHRQILAAFKERDAAMVRTLTQEHCEHTRQRLGESLKRFQSRPGIEGISRQTASSD